MNYQILKPEEILSYAEPKTDLEIKLFEAVKHFSDAYDRAQESLDEWNNEDLFQEDWESACNDLKDEITRALAALATGDADKAREILESI